MVSVPLRDITGAVIAVARVDDADAERVSTYRWHIGSDGYPCRTVAKRKLGLHRFILGLEPGDPRVVDHIDHDAFNCQRSNLRVCTRSENAQNRAPRERPRGVRRRGRRWAAYGRLGSRQVSIGRFDSEQAAADAAARWRERHLPFATN